MVGGGSEEGTQRDVAPSMEEGVRRILIVAYYFPPSGGPGVQRVLKFVKYLREFGFEPTVLTVNEGAYPQHDLPLARDIPEGVAVVRTRSLDPFGIYARLTGRSKKEAVLVGSVKREGGFVERMASWVRANAFLPDARVGWVPFAVRESLRLHGDNPFDVVFTSGPPHSVHLIGQWLKRRSHIPWIADFRDLWSDSNFADELRATGIARRFDVRLEKKVLAEADRIVTVSPFWREVLLYKSGRREDEIAVIHNGFDPDDFHAGIDAGNASRNEFTLAHIGSLYGSRNPRTLWEAIKQLRSQGEISGLRVQLLGMVDETVRKSILMNGLGSIVNITSYVSHTEAVEAMQRATALLLVIEPFQNAAGMITGKLYEYLAAGRPIIGLGPEDGDAARLLSSLSAGQMADHNNREHIVRCLKDLYDKWETNVPLQAAASDSIQLYSRKEQTRVLASLMNSVI